MNRIAVSCAAALALPLALGAQAPAPPATASAPNPVTSSFQDIGGSFGRRLIAAFDSIPAARYGYRPTAPQQSVGDIAQHLETANYVLCESLGGTRRATTAKDSLPGTVKAAWPKDTLVARLRGSLRFCTEAFARMSDAGLADSVPLGAPGRAGRLVRARALGLFVTDLAEHYAQVASYMRLMGMVPPSAQARPRS